ncbi:hypothetical protein MNBD_ACTINO01-1767 [hydrothermal vent metagenome]|uniref:DUF1269 domain-containing protein n=1 Tax=hydrothermal vent metagenome TaxID=652676 RepID=A0A3B0RMV1_9ZZZZ
MEQIGPLQLLVIGFADPQLDGSILSELVAASDSGTIRVVDVLGVYKDEAGNVAAAQMSDLTQDEAMTYGAWIGALIGLGAGSADGAEVGALAGAMSAFDEYEYGLDADAVATIAQDIPAGGAAMLAIIEHTWAIGFRNAMRDSGGILIAQDFLSPEALIALGAGA